MPGLPSAAQPRRGAALALEADGMRAKTLRFILMAWLVTLAALAAVMIGVGISGAP